MKDNGQFFSEDENKGFCAAAATSTKRSSLKAIKELSCRIQEKLPKKKKRKELRKENRECSPSLRLLHVFLLFVQKLELRIYISKKSLDECKHFSARKVRAKVGLALLPSAIFPLCGSRGCQTFGFPKFQCPNVMRRVVALLCGFDAASVVYTTSSQGWPLWAVGLCSQRSLESREVRFCVDADNDDDAGVAPHDEGSLFPCRKV